MRRDAFNPCSTGPRPDPLRYRGVYPGLPADQLGPAARRQPPPASRAAGQTALAAPSLPLAGSRGVAQAGWQRGQGELI